MAKNRRANSVMFGFDFQVNAAIVLMLEHIDVLDSLRLESEHEDIELKLNNGEYVLAQSKAVEKGSSDFRNVRANLKKALETLSEGSVGIEANKLIFITNSFNPFKDEASRGIFSGPPSRRRYDTLPDSSKEIIDKYLETINNSLDKDKLWIYTIPFETDDDEEKYKYIRQKVNDFIGELRLNIPGMESRLLSVWQETVFKNGTKSDTEIKLNKKDIVWPMLVIATDIGICEEEFLDCFEPDVYDEVVYQYKSVIDSCCERYEFFIKVLYDYSLFRTEKRSERARNFAITRWEDYIDEFSIPGIDPEVQEALIKIVLYNIVKRRMTIEKIKKGVNL